MNAPTARTTHLHANAGDPTRTETFRGRTESSYNARWETVRGRLRETIVDQNALGLISTRPPAPTAPTFGVRSTDQLTRFDPWFRSVLAAEIVRPVPLPRAKAGEHETASWIREAYAKGLSLSRTQLRQSAYEMRAPDASVSDRISAETHRTGLEYEFQEAYRDVRTAGEATHTAVTRAFGEAVATGATASELTKTLTGRVDAVGQTRTATLIQVRVVDSVNEAALREYAAAGVDEVGYQIEATPPAQPPTEQDGEWETAGDTRVCPQCRMLAGRTWSLSDILSGNAPRPVRDTHPGCRCFVTLTG